MNSGLKNHIIGMAMNGIKFVKIQDGFMFIELSKDSEFATEESLQIQKEILGLYNLGLKVRKI